MIPPFPAAVPDAYSLEVQIYRGYWMVSWFKREFGHREQRHRRASAASSPKSSSTSWSTQVPPGSMGLVLQPYWSPGVKVPGPEAKGAIIGFGDVHTRAHLYRAILEGLAYGLREGGERCQRRSGVEMTEIRVAGGGSQSDAAMQITADIFGLPTARPHVYEASGPGRGDRRRGGCRDSTPTSTPRWREMTRVRRHLRARSPRTEKIYDGLYNEVYLQDVQTAPAAVREDPEDHRVSAVGQELQN